MCRNTSAGGRASRNRRVRPGAWTKRLCLSVAAGTIYTVRWIGTESPSRHCSAITAACSLRRHFSVQPSPRKQSLGLARSILAGNKATRLGLRLLAKEDCRWRAVEVRARRYFNNVVEQDHRAIKSVTATVRCETYGLICRTPSDRVQI
jgi:hypothetical protein